MPATICSHFYSYESLHLPVPTVRFNTIATSLHALTWMQTNAKKWHYTAIEKSERHWSIAFVTTRTNFNDNSYRQYQTLSTPLDPSKEDFLYAVNFHTRHKQPVGHYERSVHQEGLWCRCYFRCFQLERARLVPTIAKAQKLHSIW